jgi:CBS domain containing-hemolysin-like protein
MNNSSLLMNIVVWVGIAFCISQSAVFSGLNLALFSISKLRLEVEAAGGNRDAVGLLALRKDSNLTLATVLWGNVTNNVLLTLLSDSVLAGIGAFADIADVPVLIMTGSVTPFGNVGPDVVLLNNSVGPRLAKSRVRAYRLPYKSNLLERVTRLVRNICTGL